MPVTQSNPPVDAMVTGPVAAPPRPRSESRQTLVQVWRFCVTGGLAYLVNLGVYITLLWGLDIPYLWAASGAFVFGWLTTFVFNKYWTFQRHELSTLTQGVRCLTVSLVSLGLNLVVLHLLVQGGAHEVVSQALAIIAVAPINFLMSRHWSFR
jgi:putative flippase GtrA